MCLRKKQIVLERYPQDMKLDNSDIFENIEGKYRQMGEFEVELKRSA